MYMALLFQQFSPRLLKELILADNRNVEKTQALVFFNPYNFFLITASSIFTNPNFSMLFTWWKLTLNSVF